MSRVFPLPRAARHLSILLLSVTLLACGGGGSSAASPPAPPPSSDGGTPPPGPAPIEGVATPTSVAVVTATNAQ